MTVRPPPGVTVVAGRPEDTYAVAARLARALETIIQRGEASTVLVGLVGVMGAGKTAFVRGFVDALGGGTAAEVNSPTYALAQPYPTDPPVLHVDLFRLDSAEEFDAIDGPLLVDSEGFVLVEWVDRMLGRSPATAPWVPMRTRDWVEVRLDERPDGSRAIHLVAHGARATRWLRGAFGP